MTRPFQLEIDGANRKGVKMNKEILDIQWELVNKYGIKEEIEKTIEELTELSLELQYYLNKDIDNREKIKEELVDTTMKLAFIHDYFKFTADEMELMRNKKIRKIKAKYLSKGEDRK